MRTPEHRSIPEKSPRVLSRADFYELLKKPTHSLSREKVTNMVHRNAVAILGEELTRKTESEMREHMSGFRDRKTIVGTGTVVIHRQYAQTIPAIAVGLSIEERDPTLQMLCVRIYEQEIAKRVEQAKDTAEKASLEALRKTISKKISAHITKYKPAVDMDLLMKLFTTKIPVNQQRHLLQMLHHQRTSDFFEKLQRLTNTTE